MAAPLGNSDDEVISQINVTPLVDVVLVLLVIFLITAPVIYQSAIKVKLPTAETADSGIQKDTQLRFMISEDEKISYQGEIVTIGELEASLTKSQPILQEGENAIIQADRKTPHGSVVQLMDILRKHGLNRFALSVDKKN